MEIIDMQALKETGVRLGYGAYGCVKEYLFDQEKYALKILRSTKLCKSLSLNMKFDFLSKLSLRHSCIPSYFVKDGKKIIGYLSKEVQNRRIYELPTNDEKLKALLETDAAIKELHYYGVIHSDIHAGNILFDGTSRCLTDFDNCSVPNFRTKRRLCSLDAKEYLKKYGLNEGLDNYLFNLLTYRTFISYRRNEPFELSLKRTSYIVGDSEFVKISRALLLQDDVYDSDLLVDVLRSDKTLREKVYSLNYYT